jgi:hypothetical protein
MNRPPSRTAARELQTGEGSVRFSLQNWVLLAAGAFCVIAGFVLLSGGSTVAAPLLLILGYVVLIPIGIIR